MRARRLSVFLLGIGLAVPLASCGGGGAGPSTATGTSAAATEPTSSRGPGAAGAEAPSREVRAAESTLASYLEAGARGDWKAACSLLSSSTRGQLEELARGIGGKAKGCASVLALSSKGQTAVDLAGPPTHALTSLRVEGDKASARWVGPGGRTYAMPMVREGGGWRPAQPAPYPSGGEP